MALTEAVVVMVSLGFLGGLARALFGLSKSVQRGEKIVPWYLFLTLLVSCILGGLVSFLSNSDYRAAAILGYAGTDILENIASVVVPKELLIKNG